MDPYATPEDAGLVPAEAAAAPVADSEREAMGVRVQSLQNELAVQKAEVDRLATLNEQLSSRVASREGEVQDLRLRLAAALGRGANGMPGSFPTPLAALTRFSGPVAQRRCPTARPSRWALRTAISWLLSASATSRTWP